MSNFRIRIFVPLRDTDVQNFGQAFPNVAQFCSMPRKHFTLNELTLTITIMYFNRLNEDLDKK